MKFLKDYDFELHYHQKKANVVVDALSRKSLHVFPLMIQEIVLLEKFMDMNLSITLSHDRIKLNSIRVTSDLKYKSMRLKQVTNYFKRKKVDRTK